MSKPLRPRSRGWALCLLCLAAACAPARTPVHRATAQLHPDISWYTSSAAADAPVLARWREAVGAPAILRVHAAAPEASAVTVASWNMANGDGDLAAFVRTLPAGRPLVLLLQEAFRAGPEVPARLAGTARYAGRLGGARAPADVREIEALGAALGLNVYYVPSMRNGGATSDEDRGNAILSSLPLTGFTAIELPFERQRRVAVAATAHGRTGDGRPWRIRVVNAHFDNTAGVRRAWIGGEFGRARQARALRDAIATGDPVVLGGDFNTWFGSAEIAYRETAAAFPDAAVRDGRPTFRGLLRLDHLFFRLAPGWRATYRRAESRFGSDHYPLVGTVEITAVPNSEFQGGANSEF